MVLEIDACDGALAQADGGSAIAGDEVAEKLEEDGVVSDGQHAFVAGVLDQHVLKSGEGGVGREGLADFDPAVKAELCGDKLSGLHGALEGAGDDDVDLDLEGAQEARHQHALVFALLDESALDVKDGVFAAESGAGVAH